MIRVVAFDLDDTLWRMGPVIMRAEQKLSDWMQSEVPHLRYDPHDLRELRDEVLQEHPGIGHRLTELRRRTLEKALRRSNIPPEKSSLLAGRAMEVFLAARNQVQFFDGALEAIEILAARYHLGALTNGNADIHRLGLGDHFSFAFSAEQVGAPKPAPALFHAALEHTGCKPGEMVYVGDDPVKDMDTANRVGLYTVWLRHKSGPGPGETEPDHIIDDIRELPEAIEKLGPR